MKGAYIIKWGYYEEKSISSLYIGNYQYHAANHHPTRSCLLS